MTEAPKVSLDPKTILERAAAALPARPHGPSEHESRISAHFAGQCEWTGTARAFDKDMLILGFTNRSGSNLLGDYLRQTGLVQSLGENLNQDSVISHANRKQIANFPDYMRFLVDIGPSRAHFGIKASWGQMAMLYRWNIPAMFKACRVIVIQRRSILRQAVSMSIASQTRKWSSRQTGTGATPVYDAKAIVNIMQSIERSNATMLRLCEALGLRHTTLYYEDLLFDPDASVQKTLRDIGIDCEVLSLAEPAIQRQSDHINEDFAARMQIHLREMFGLNGIEKA